MENHNGKWRLAGYDVISDELYNIRGDNANITEYDTEEAAQAAAIIQIQRIEELQPIEEAGEIQDKIYIIDPRGKPKIFEPKIKIPNPNKN